ncbi:3-hydroxyacyl-[acyl-carrier-protein] dehydratase [Nonlabens dokdonensis]|uniref:3-hydroxyacyl-[acyl-carrier-protein] dehydratase n=2 Tax=Nonlabens dokdonensis TaxID=328515 RepID=A0ABX5PUV9_9FLAO|nr:ACP dehydratase [Nonlabens dokdonensis]AGC78280.1 putative acyl carrier protein dehydrase [Nonlabens dokdonensis DSW-6]PZX37832.1 3-hydroxyacyl-[acyl-carrier-protein] dehydratase [Nonlabens dokdonensis]
MLLNPLEKIVANLPYGDGFKFVDQLLELDEESVIGIYRFRESEYFYKHHFINNPITPGVILIECMAQIGLACLGSYLMRENEGNPQFVFTENHINFLNTVVPETTVIVSAKKEYFRFGKLKVVVQMMDENENKIAEGWMSGMIVNE